MTPSHYLAQCWLVVCWILKNKFQWNLNQNTNIFMQENTIEKVVCKMAAILFQPQCVKDLYCICVISRFQRNKSWRSRSLKAASCLQLLQSPHRYHHGTCAPPRLPTVRYAHLPLRATPRMICLTSLDSQSHSLSLRTAAPPHWL